MEKCRCNQILKNTNHILILWSISMSIKLSDDQLIFVSIHLYLVIEILSLILSLIICPISEKKTLATLLNSPSSIIIFPSTLFSKRWHPFGLLNPHMYYFYRCILLNYFISVTCANLYRPTSQTIEIDILKWDFVNRSAPQSRVASFSFSDIGRHGGSSEILQ